MDGSIIRGSQIRKIFINRRQAGFQIFFLVYGLRFRIFPSCFHRPGIYMFELLRFSSNFVEIVIGENGGGTLAYPTD